MAQEFFSCQHCPQNSLIPFEWIEYNLSKSVGLGFPPKVRHRGGPENTHCRGRITRQLVYRLTELDLTKQEKVFLFVSTVTTESKSVKQETGCAVVIPPYG